MRCRAWKRRVVSLQYPRAELRRIVRAGLCFQFDRSGGWLRDFLGKLFLRHFRLWVTQRSHTRLWSAGQIWLELGRLFLLYLPALAAWPVEEEKNRGREALDRNASQ